MSIADELRSQWRNGGILVRLVLLNAGVFLALHLIGFLSWISGNEALDVRILMWLVGYSDPHLLLHRPWTVITYMFTHYELMHLFWNLVVLWFAGGLFQNILGEKRLLGNYILGGLSGFLLYFLGANYLPAHLNYSGGTTIEGASAGIMSIMIGIATFRPDTSVRMLFAGIMPLKYVALIMLVIDLIMIRQGANSGGHIAHLGGALYGFLAARQLKQGSDWSLAFVGGLERIGGFFRFRRRSHLRVAKGFRGRSRQSNEALWNASRKARQERIDAILDKISRSGYDSLSREEKDILFKASHEK